MTPAKLLEGRGVYFIHQISLSLCTLICDPTFPLHNVHTPDYIIFTFSLFMGDIAMFATCNKYWLRSMSSSLSVHQLAMKSTKYCSSCQARFAKSVFLGVCLKTGKIISNKTIMLAIFPLNFDFKQHLPGHLAVCWLKKLKRIINLDLSTLKQLQPF